jgi:kynurenine formamidase
MDEATEVNRQYQRLLEATDALYRRLEPDDDDRRAHVTTLLEVLQSAVAVSLPEPPPPTTPPPGPGDGAGADVLRDGDPSEETVRSWLSTLKTWGRWGSDDDRGTLNHIGAEQRTAAARLVTGAMTVSCSARVTYRRPNHGLEDVPVHGIHPSWATPFRFVVQDGADARDHTARHSAYDAFLIAPHGAKVTHLDAPAHTVLDGRVYGGATATSDLNAGVRGTIETVTDGVFGRGVLLDVARTRGVDWLDDGDAIRPEDLDAAEQAGGVRVGRGDVLFVRTGYRRRMPDGPVERFAGRPGLQASCLPWLYEREVAVLGADVATDVVPHGYALGMPVHTVGMWAMGLWLIDNCDLERLGNVCAERGRYEFATVLAPLVLAGGTGSPMNPLALF